MARPVHFEIHVEDPQRAIAFYSTLFGWEFSQWGKESYWLAYGNDPDGNLFGMLQMDDKVA